MYRSNLLCIAEFSRPGLLQSKPADYDSPMPPPNRQESWNGIIGRLLRPRRAQSHEFPDGGDGSVPDARLLGLRMAALYRHWQRTAGPDLVRLTDALLDHIGLRAGTPLAGTCREAAAAVSRWQGSAYHSARHHAEVATNAMVLATISARQGGAIPPHELGLLLAAALAHDIYWESDGGQARFAAEERSAEALDAIAARCGATEGDRLAMRVLVLATEPKSRAEIADLVAGRGAADRLPRPLAPLHGNKPLLRLASILSDADLLSSAGLTQEWTRVQGQRLASEGHMPIGTAVWQHFFDTIVGSAFLSLGGQHFAANLARIRRGKPGAPQRSP